MNHASLLENIPLILIAQDGDDGPMPAGDPDAGAQPAQTGEGNANQQTAQDDGTPPMNENGEAPPASGLGGLGMFLPLIIIMVGFLFLMSWTQKRERRKKEQLINAVKKHDRVQTIGGIIGTVVDIKDNEITLKVDESSNTRLVFSKAAISTVLSSDE